MAAPQASASFWASSSSGVGSAMKGRPRECLAPQQGGGSVTVFPIGAGQIVQCLQNYRNADGIGPGQRTARVVHPVLHGDIDSSGLTHLLIDGVGPFVSQ